MPQPSLISGVAGTVHTEAYQGPNIGDQMVQMAEAFTRVKQAEQANAMKKLEVMLGNVDKLPIDPNAIRKQAKKAGIPLAPDDHIAAIAQAGKQQPSAAAASPSAPKEPALSTGGMAGNAVAGAKNLDAAAAAQKKWQENMTPEQGKNMVLDTFIARARQLAEAKFKDEKAKTEYNTQLTTLKQAALSGDGQAVGKLMAAGEVPYNISQLAWQQATPEQKTMMYNIALGHETEAQKAERETQIFQSLMAHGSLTAADAYSVAHSMASGQGLTPEQQKKLGTMSIDQLGKQAKFIDDLVALGVPADKLASTAEAAQYTGSLINALPKGLQPVMAKELELRKQQINAEMARANAEMKRSATQDKRLELTDRQMTVAEKREERLAKEGQWKREATLAKLHLDEVTGQNKEALDALKIVVSAKSKGIKPDDKMYQMVIDKLKSRGVDEDFLNYMSGQQGAAKVGGNPVDDELK